MKRDHMPFISDEDRDHYAAFTKVLLINEITNLKSSVKKLEDALAKANDALAGWNDVLGYERAESRACVAELQAELAGEKKRSSELRKEPCEKDNFRCCCETKGCYRGCVRIAKLEALLLRMCDAGEIICVHEECLLYAEGKCKNLQPKK